MICCPKHLNVEIKMMILIPMEQGFGEQWSSSARVRKLWSMDSQRAASPPPTNSTVRPDNVAFMESPDNGNTYLHNMFFVLCYFYCHSCLFTRLAQSIKW